MLLFHSAGKNINELLNRWLQLAEFMPFFSSFTNGRGANFHEPYRWDSIMIMHATWAVTAMRHTVPVLSSVSPFAP